jgi:hypothetical protein
LHEFSFRVIVLQTVVAVLRVRYLVCLVPLR